MDFSRHLKLLKRLDLPNDQFVIVGSGQLGVRGIRESKDLDVLISDKLWSQLIKKYSVKKEWGVDRIHVGGEIEMLGDGSVYRDSSIASIEEIIETADIIDGIRYINLVLLKKFKQKMGREKDFNDIKLIDDYLTS